MPPRPIGYVLDRWEFSNPVGLGEKFLEGIIMDKLEFPIPQFQATFDQMVEYLKKLYPEILKTNWDIEHMMVFKNDVTK